MKDTTGDIVTLTITLDDVEPRVWRRLEIPAEYSFEQLHPILNTAMGWLDLHLHLHEFEVAGKRYGDGVDMSPQADATLVEADLVLGDVARDERRFAYWYDFGDDWWHTVEIAGAAPAQAGVFYPRCTEGAGACPPEDCGGPPGFEEFKRALADPTHPDHEELAEWYGGEFDQDAFSTAATNRLLRMLTTGELPENWD